MSASFSMNFLFAASWKTSSSATFCIFIAINLTHGAFQESCLCWRGVSLAASDLLTRKPNYLFLFFLRKLDFLSWLEYHSNCEKYPPFSRCFRTRRALLNQVRREFVTMSHTWISGVRDQGAAMVT